jgi:uncharacterized membrane protein
LHPIVSEQHSLQALVLNGDKKMRNKEIFDQWHDDPSNWRWGVFYYNKQDKRLFPPKRIRGFGWTVNFANPYSYLALLGIILVFFAFVLLLSPMWLNK